MAYFLNSNEESQFNKTCQKCKLFKFEELCPINYLQNLYNYEATKEKTASDILDYLVKNDGTCIFFEQYKEKLKLMVKYPPEIKFKNYRIVDEDKFVIYYEYKRKIHFIYVKIGEYPTEKICIVNDENGKKFDEITGDYKEEIYSELIDTMINAYRKRKMNEYAKKYRKPH